MAKIKRKKYGGKENVTRIGSQSLHGTEAKRPPASADSSVSEGQERSGGNRSVAIECDQCYVMAMDDDNDNNEDNSSTANNSNIN